jgi:hypothetical protein
MYRLFFGFSKVVKSAHRNKFVSEHGRRQQGKVKIKALVAVSKYQLQNSF